MLLALTWAAGSIDAISYLGLGHVFTAMMTGNTVLLGLALGQGEVLAALRSILALIGFGLGVGVGALVVERDEEPEEWPPAITGALALEGVLLGIFAALWHLSETARSPGIVHVLIVLSGLAMGIQAAAVHRLGIPGIATTYITGTLTSLMVDLVSWIRSASGRPRASTSAGTTVVDKSLAVQWEQRVGLLAGVFFVYGLGALTGGVLQARSSPLGTLAPLIAVAFVVVNASFRYRHH
jgi:uncharacterized membrane protein YoaK (UPF0700 family)